MKKVFRDPVHNIISFDKDTEKSIIDLINTPEMQRLRRIKQLGVSYVTYPGADHTRFAHSLGVAYLARMIIEALANLKDSDDETRQNIKELEDDGLLLVAAALLHDCGHGPFSHALEEFTKKNHEQWTIEIIKDSSTQVNKVLQSISTNASERVSKIIQRTDKPLLVKIISSQLDVDRCDYLLRDNIMTGAGYGKFDFEWMLHSLRVRKIAGEPEIVLDISKGKHTAEQFILARYWMYNQVYYHKTTRSAEVLILKILNRARDTKKKIYCNTIMKKILTKIDTTITTGEFLTLDDVIFLYHFKEWESSADKILSDLCKRFLNRNLFKAIETTEITKKIGTKRFIEQVYEPLVAKAGANYPKDYYIESDEPENAPYKDSYLFPRKKSEAVANDEEEEATKQIHVLLKDGTLSEFSRESGIIETLRNKSLTVERLYYPGELQQDVSKIIRSACA